MEEFVGRFQPAESQANRLSPAMSQEFGRMKPALRLHREHGRA